MNKKIISLMCGIIIVLILFFNLPKDMLSFIFSWDSILGWSTLILAIATIFLAISTQQSTKNAEKTLELSRSDSMLEYRPYVHIEMGFKGLEFNEKNLDNFIFGFLLTNSGKSIGQDIYVKIDKAIMGDQEDLEKNFLSEEFSKNIEKENGIEIQNTNIGNLCLYPGEKAYFRGVNITKTGLYKDFSEQKKSIILILSLDYTGLNYTDFQMSYHSKYYIFYKPSEIRNPQNNLLPIYNCGTLVKKESENKKN